MVAAGSQVVRATTSLSFAAASDCLPATGCSSPLCRAVRSVVTSNVAAMPRRPGRFGAMWAGGAEGYPPFSQKYGQKTARKRKANNCF